MKNKHLSFDNRLDIEKGLKDNLSFKEIRKNIGKDCTTVRFLLQFNQVIFINISKAL